MIDAFYAHSRSQPHLDKDAFETGVGSQNDGSDLDHEVSHFVPRAL